MEDKEKWFDLGKCPKCNSDLQYGDYIPDRKCPKCKTYYKNFTSKKFGIDKWI